MVVCQFFLKGQCKFGDNCRNEHPANSRQSGFGSSWNRTGGGNNDTKINLPFSASSISNDLTPHVDKPMWPLSSYATSKHEPLLISGLDESPEELRVKAAAAMASGNINAYLEYEGRQIVAADQMFINVRNNSAQAYDQACKQSELSTRLAAVTNTPNTTSAFGNNTKSASTLPSTSAFSNNNITTSAFGQPAFGQSAFGQFGQPSFGQPVQNQSTVQTGAFGQRLNDTATVSAFGQPSSVFSQPAAAATSSFIKPASGAFNAFNNTGSSSAFGNNTTPATNTAAAGSGFSAFASQPSATQTPPTAGSVFGQPSFGQPIQPAAAVAAATSAFGSPAPAPTSVFGTSSAFGVLSQPQTKPANPFGANATPSAFNTNTTNPVFVQSAFGNAQSTSAFSSGPTISRAFDNSNNLSNNSTFAPTAPSISIDMQSGVSSNPSSNTLSATTPSTPSRTKSIYKPGSTPYDQQIPPNYKEALPKSVVQAFENQQFEWGDVPEWVPPVDIR